MSRTYKKGKLTKPMVVRVYTVHFSRILQWWGKTAKGPIFLVLLPG
jgi:hypothetical protein